MRQSIKLQLAAATGALLASAAPSAAELVDIGEWDINSALLYYSESDRVTAVEPVINARKIIDTDESITVKLTLDTLTGASASGAVPSMLPQTFTRPSGSGNFVTSSANLPLDDTFHDTRAALAATWTRPGLFGMPSDLGFNISKEYDYQSIGVSSTMYKNLNRANTTLSTGLSFSFDEQDPVGDRPVAFGIMQPAGQPQQRASGDTGKTVIDILAGVSQVINTHSLMQFNYSLSLSDGYLTDPYKVISVVDSDTGNPLFENTLEPTLPTVIYENRPDSRMKNSLFTLYKRSIGGAGDVLDTSYRYMFDDWGIDSHTLDFRYRKQLSHGRFLQPHIRFYRQSEADFYAPFYVSGNQPTPGEGGLFGSADYRLGAFSAYTLGLEYGGRNSKNAWSIAVEYYLQSTDEPANKFGELEQLELAPDVEAVIVKLLFDF